MHPYASACGYCMHLHTDTVRIYVRILYALTYGYCYACIPVPPPITRSSSVLYSVISWLRPFLLFLLIVLSLVTHDLRSYLALVPIIIDCFSAFLDWATLVLLLGTSSAVPDTFHFGARCPIEPVGAVN
ncbi:uncharacterized protein SCHCODRAFT_02072379 [Schizophyllum commune H4-8]|uniref:uncharacterized protein n=1 Tax=Schizophyllum commune (strain H4-8 / FGSC 9210) TaxID=578458 RepID=UPI002160B146|nr:uncharacterized protein SCHCODRAFT_02072379 [Schizophyllum commune H4-8]KAI5887777.1 hypothetical protein SCHCODRAFT_02072379 [Schizophyllum commune H4-8]